MKIILRLNDSAFISHVKYIHLISHFSDENLF